MQSVEKGSNKLADRRLQKSVITAGLNYYALPNLVVKADYAHRIVGKGDYNTRIWFLSVSLISAGSYQDNRLLTNIYVRI